MSVCDPPPPHPPPPRAKIMGEDSKYHSLLVCVCVCVCLCVCVCACARVCVCVCVFKVELNSRAPVPLFQAKGLSTVVHRADEWRVSSFPPNAWTAQSAHTGRMIGYLVYLMTAWGWDVPWL